MNYPVPHHRRKDKTIRERGNEDAAYVDVVTLANPVALSITSLGAGAPSRNEAMARVIPAASDHVPLHLPRSTLCGRGEFLL